MWPKPAQEMSPVCILVVSIVITSQLSYANGLSTTAWPTRSVTGVGTTRSTTAWLASSRSTLTDTTKVPTTVPTLAPTAPTQAPTNSQPPTASTKAPTSAPTQAPTQTPTPTDTAVQHFQFKANILFSDFKDKLNKNESVDLGKCSSGPNCLRSQLAAQCGLPPSRISNIITQNDTKDGKAVITFDVSPNTVSGGRTTDSAFNAFTYNVNIPNAVQLVKGSAKTLQMVLTAYRWKDDRNCPTHKCDQTKERCWVLQRTAEAQCVCLTCPKTAIPEAAGSTSGLDKNGIIIIAVVAAVVALVIVIVVVVCLLRSSKKNDKKNIEDSYEGGSQHSEDTDEMYNTNFSHFDH